MNWLLIRMPALLLPRHHSFFLPTPSSDSQGISGPSELSGGQFCPRDPPFLGSISPAILPSDTGLPELWLACEVKWKSVSRVRLFVTPRTIACQPPWSPWDSPGKNTGVGSLSFSRGSFQPRKWIQVSHIAGGFFAPPGSPDDLQWRELTSALTGQINSLSCQASTPRGEMNSLV